MMIIKYTDNMPSLNLSIPIETAVSDSVELNETLLRQWIRRLPKHDVEQYLNEYITALKRFNGNKLGLEQRLSLLDIYREPINKLVFTYSQNKLHKYSSSIDQYNILISAIAEVLLELAVGYKIIVIESLKSNANLKLNNLALMAVNRAGEQLSYIALHAYKFYQTIPAKVLNELHQLYMLSLSCDVEDKLPKLATVPAASTSYKSRYCQLLLVCICNPYGLRSNEVIKAYGLMKQFAAVAELSLLPQDSKAMAGHFYINCLSDDIPIPSVLPMIDDQTQPPALVLDTKPALVAVDILFQRAVQVDNHPQGTDIELLKSLIPYLNTSYERKELRRSGSAKQHIYVATSIDTIYNCIGAVNASSDDINTSLNAPWTLLNKTSSGYLVSRQESFVQHDALVGDLVGTFDVTEQNKVNSSKVGFIRWIRTNAHDETKMGISLIEGDPVPVKYGLDENTEMEPALFLPEVARIHQAASLITQKKVVSMNSLLRIKPNKKRFEFNLKVDAILSSGNNFDHLSLTDSD